MTRKCIRDIKINGLIFAQGCDYKISYNDIDGRIYIYNPFGYTDISMDILNRYFL